MYPQGIDAIGKVDQTFIVILGFAIVMLLLITATMIYFVIRYSRKRHPEPADIKGNTWLELLWTVVPIMIVMLMFYFGWSSFKALRTVPKDAMNVTVKARMWSWMFEYPGGIETKELVVPEKKAVKVNLTSLDVIHSFYVPAFRIKMDCVPGMNTYTWFKADQPGDYDILCAEYCGLRHAFMLSKVHVLSEADYHAWWEKQTNAGKAASGKAVFEKYNCTDCHTMDGTSDIAPSLKDIAGTTQTVIEDGKEKQVTVDRAYVKESILNPGKQVVKGFDDIMPPFKGEISGDELDQLLDYLMPPVHHEEAEHRGESIMEEQGCMGCHSTDGSIVAGPSFKGILGRKTVVLRDGKEVTITADEDYLRRSITNPEADVVKGFDPIMPAFDTLSKEDIQAIIDYLKTLK